MWNLSDRDTGDAWIPGDWDLKQQLDITGACGILLTGSGSMESDILGINHRALGVGKTKNGGSDGSAFDAGRGRDNSNWLGVARLGKWKGDAEVETKSRTESHLVCSSVEYIIPRGVDQHNSSTK